MSVAVSQRGRHGHTDVGPSFAGARGGPTPILPGCPGHHISTVADAPEHLKWYGVPRPDRVRVIEATCWRCGSTAYELCSSGGIYLIRRSMGSKVSDSPRVQRLIAERWWAAVLAGRAV